MAVLNLSTVNQFSDKNPVFSVGSLRHLIFHSETNGFKEAFPKVGRRRLINDDIFFEVIEKQNSRGTQG